MKMSKLEYKYQIKWDKVRASTLVSPFGVGAMMDLPDQVLMTASGEWWEKKKLTIIHDERLEKVLKVKGFKSPIVKIADNNSEDKKEENLYMPFVQFPTWYFCPKCRTFKPIIEWENDYKKHNGKDKVMMKLVCSKCKVKLAPARIVIACENGHIDDFPWIEWVHLKNHKKICKNPELKIKTSGVSSGLEGISVECECCKARISLSGTFSSEDKNEFEELEKKAKEQKLVDENFSLRCKGNRPWDGGNEECSYYPRTLQRGATNIYFPKIESSIVIPPYSDKYTKAIEQSLEFQNMNTNLEFIEKRKITGSAREETIREAIESISKETLLNKNVVEKIILRKLDDSISENISTDKTKYKEEEYRALVGDLSYDAFNQEDFKVEPVDGVNYNRSYIRKIVLIHKMKEVRALTGFSRINGPDNNLIDSESNSEAGKCKIIRPLSDTSWYPAI
ncbi:MAG: hypothetical protein F8N39_00140, partial [Clostridiaceae bacterium]|nr:hypothetical protein [Clostridiaceae bacterium]